MKKNELNFEKKLKRLEEISVLLENEEIDLDKAIELYEEGLALSKECSERLKTAELRINELKKNSLDMNSNLITD
ncbi:MAG: exodeoxyribonuclease VII small subunit [Bacteroidota bacterium]|nr:exodeoxyribonuclease VII small subunit [Bacteroidota bacterium]